MSASTTIWTGGTIHTDFHTSPVDSFAVRDGAVIAVGSEDEVWAAVDSGAAHIDLDGATVVPGFIDAHVHPVHAGLMLASCSLAEAGGSDEALRLIGEYAAAHPDDAWITGGGWSMEWFAGGTPSKEQLDQVVPDRPAVLINSDGHGSWANSVALRLAGIRADTADPEDGRIERLSDGSPQGTLHEGAMDLVARLQPTPTTDELLVALLAGQEHLHSHGITGWQDALVGAYSSLPDVLATYLAAARQDVLTARVVGSLWWDRGRGAEQIPELVARRELAGGDAGTGRFRATTVKIMQDGVAENFTAAMTSPYLDVCGCQSANSGLSYVPPETLAEIVPALDELDFQLHFHALGDRAVREALDALEAAIARNGLRRNRHHLAHLQVVHPDDIPRFAALDATANLQALWACHSPQMDELTLPFLGADRAAWQYPFESLRRSGANLCAGSDWPVSDAAPLAAVDVAVTRENPEAPHLEPFLTTERLDPAAILSAYTAGSAWVTGLEDLTGTIGVGRRADFAVLDGDPMAPGGRRISQIGVRATYVDGMVVFEA